MNTQIDFRYTFISPKAIRTAVWDTSHTFLWNIKEIKKVVKQIIIYNVDILTFQYQLLERLEKRNEYRVIRQVERDIKIIEERLNIYREFDNISKLGERLQLYREFENISK